MYIRRSQHADMISHITFTYQQLKVLILQLLVSKSTVTNHVCMLASPDIDSLKTSVGNSNNNDLISNNWSLISTNKRTPGLSHL